MSLSAVHHCTCPRCGRPEPHPDQILHQQINLLVSRLDEQQRRWFVVVRYIAGTVTAAELRVTACLKRGGNETGERVSDNDMRRLTRSVQPGIIPCHRAPSAPMNEQIIPCRALWRHPEKGQPDHGKDLARILAGAPCVQRVCAGGR